LILAHGKNTATDGGADMIYYPTPAGGFVFSVGSITFVGSLVVDPNLQIVVRNALNDALAHAPIPGKIRIVAGTAQHAAVNTVYAKQLRVQVTDTAHHPLSGITVIFGLPASGPGGSFAGAAAVVTDAHGMATAPALTANTVAGSFTITVFAAGIATSATITLTNRPGPAEHVTVAAGDGQSTSPGQSYAVPLQVLVTDAYGNLTQGVKVTFLVQPNPGSGSRGTFLGMTRATTVTKGSGKATAPALKARTLPGVFTVFAFTNGVPEEAVFTLTIT
jgi:hypothetical protein